MTRILTPSFRFIAQLEDNLQVSVSKNTKAGDEVSRTELSEVLHSELHSALLNENANITVNGQSHILTEGKLTAFWEWNSEPITESDLDELTGYYNSLSETVEIVKDFEMSWYSLHRLGSLTL